MATKKANQAAQPEEQTVSFVAAEHLGKDLLQLVLQELRALPKLWHLLPEYDQNAVIERARERIESGVAAAVSLIVSEGKVVVVADLEGVTIKDQIKATFIVARGNETNAKEALFEAVGGPCTIIVADAKAFTGGMHEIKGEKDQRSMDLNTEYEEKEDAENYGEEGEEEEKPIRRVAALPYSRKRLTRNKDQE